VLFPKVLTTLEGQNRNLTCKKSNNMLVNIISHNVYYAIMFTLYAIGACKLEISGCLPSPSNVKAATVLEGSSVTRNFETVRQKRREITYHTVSCTLSEVKVKFTEEQATKAQRESRCIALLLL